jgi:hypothetical protein
MSVAITHTEADGRVTLEMRYEDWEQLLNILGYACGRAMTEDRELFWRYLDFVNRLNRTNPHFQQYEIPEEYREEVRP